MTDIRLEITESGGDLVLDGFDLDRDEGLESAVIVSLFTDARCLPEQLPDADENPRGYWGDSYATEDGDNTGSLLWLLKREKQVNRVLNRARDYCEQALAWMVRDKLASKVIVTTEYLSSGVLLIRVQIYRPVGDSVDFRFDYAWEQQALRSSSSTIIAG